MSKAFNFTTTKKAGWQMQCQNWVNDGQPFEIRDVENKHSKILDEFCWVCRYRYQYQFRSIESVAIFSLMQ